MTKIIADGNYAASDIAYRCSEFAAIYPITPSSTMGELVDEWSVKHRKNLWGDIVSVVEMQSEGGAAGALHGALQMGLKCSTYTASQGLLLMIPNMYKIAGEQTPFVMHVAARALATHALSIFGDHSDVMSVRHTGFAMLCAANVQEAHDMAAAAHSATFSSRVPFLHFFDGFRTSHEESRLDLMTDEQLLSILPEADMAAARERGMSPDRPTVRGTAQNPDVYFQGREAANGLYDAVPGIVSDAFKKIKAATGREYNLVEFAGDKNAENIIVAMGSGTETIAESLEHLPKGVALMKIRLYRPFPKEAFLAALPKTAKRMAVLDRTKESGSPGEPLYQDIMSVVPRNIEVFGGRYGLGSKEFKPRDVKAIVENLMRGTLKHNFTVGIKDDLTKLSLDTDAAFAIDGGYKSALLYGIGSDGTVGAVKNIVKIVGDNSDLWPQSYAVYDSKKSGGLTASHLRFSGSPIRSQYLVEQADFIAVSNFMLTQRFDVFAGLKPGGTVMINTSLAPDAAFAGLPKDAQEHLLRLRAKVYFLDANKGAAELGLGRRINTFILVNFFNLTKVIDPKIAADSAKAAIEATYRKKGDAVVRMNLDAIDRAAEFLHEYKMPSSPSNFAPDWIPAMTKDAPFEVAGVLGEIASGRGDALPTSAFAPGKLFGCGEFPTGTAKYEKRNISDIAPKWLDDKCIQCGKCAVMCPHSVVRLSAAEKFPEGIRSVPMKTPELGKDLRFALTVSPLDCTGCEICVRVCPTKALEMKPVDLADQAAFDAAVKLPAFDRSKLNLNVPKHLGLCENLFEFPGACGGCGETPYIRMLAQLFGDRMVVANATGCSSIYGANLPTTPYARNAAGRGPAWSNSLFEDNAEYGLGMRLALDQKKEMLKTALFKRGLPDVEKMMNETDIAKQRGYEAELKKIAPDLADAVVDKSLWIIGGDGWAYDIDYGGLDHVLHSGKNVNVLVLDTEGYSNTGGQQSKATPFGASMKFAVGGKALGKKDLGMIAMMSGAYVAQIALGADQAQAIRAIREAEAYPGPSLILAYSHCISHGMNNMAEGPAHQKMLVQTGAWPLYRFNPMLIEQGKNPFVLDAGGSAEIPLEKFLATENRFGMARAYNGPRFDKIVEKAESDNEYRRELKKHIAEFALVRNSPKANEG
ncbi:MAG: pyruvate:ferredoxin (flavodoxin) oxidoreductase [Rickettsiales bacterium]|jgi:pyruvate-ferredoxin/flavodoxin oxidoreductase|nr:pyruvate:ferredoxin (flavodoxin) oxidoreductase [Rickettsiales bacterium]